MSSASQVRRAGPADLALLPAIEQSAGTLFAGLPKLKHLADGPVIALDEHHWFLEDGWTWVAEDPAGTIAGFLCSEPLAGNLHVRELSVHRAAQGRGLGRALMEAAIAHARRERMPAVTLTTFRDVAWNAPFYTSLGFALLEPDEAGEALEQILADEVTHGMPLGSRCAMRLSLD